MKLLICDDSVMIRKLVEKIVRTRYPEVEIVGTAENGLVAVKLFSEHQPDVVTTDITMPEMDGITAMREMLKQKPDARVIVISAISGAENVKNAIDAGAVDFITKPFNENDFVKIFGSAVG
ncbi:MAG: response regulator [Turneriella sp.]